MPWAVNPDAHDRSDEIEVIGRVLDPALTPLDFAPAQPGTNGDEGQVIFCRGLFDSIDGGCIDLVLDVEAVPEWHIVTVRYDGFDDDLFLEIDRSADLDEQVADLARRLPVWLDRPPAADTN